jgi:hypothetical protein
MVEDFVTLKDLARRLGDGFDKAPTIQNKNGAK